MEGCTGWGKVLAVMPLCFLFSMDLKVGERGPDLLFLLKYSFSMSAFFSDMLKVEFQEFGANAIEISAAFRLKCFNYV